MKNTPNFIAQNLTDGVLHGFLKRKKEKFWRWETIMPIGDLAHCPVKLFCNYINYHNQHPKSSSVTSTNKEGNPHSYWRTTPTKDIPTKSLALIANDAKWVFSTCGIDTKKCQAACLRAMVATFMAAKSNFCGNWRSVVFQRHYDRPASAINWTQIIAEQTSLQRNSNSANKNKHQEEALQSIKESEEDWSTATPTHFHCINTHGYCIITLQTPPQFENPELQDCTLKNGVGLLEEEEFHPSKQKKKKKKEKEGGNIKH